MGKIRFFSEGNISVKIKRKRIKEFIHSIISDEKKKHGDINIIFCSDEYLMRLNTEFLKHDYFTDIITFDYSEKNCISGELFISVDRVRDNAKIYGQSLIRELYRVIFHGILHLLGYNDKSSEEIVKMREKEDNFLKQFFKSN